MVGEWKWRYGRLLFYTIWISADDEMWSPDHDVVVHLLGGLCAPGTTTRSSGYGHPLAALLDRRRLIRLFDLHHVSRRFSA
jgi:hypothetical protein